MFLWISKSLDVIIGTSAQRKLHFWLFILNPQYYQNEIWSNTVPFLILPYSPFQKRKNKTQVSCHNWNHYVRIINADFRLTKKIEARVTSSTDSVVLVLGHS